MSPGVGSTIPELTSECRSRRLKKLRANTENTLTTRGIAPTGHRAAGADAIVFVLPVRHAARLGDPLAVCTFCVVSPARRMWIEGAAVSALPHVFTSVTRRMRYPIIAEGKQALAERDALPGTGRTGGSGPAATRIVRPRARLRDRLLGT